MTPGHRQWKKSILTGGALCAAWWPFPLFIWNSNTSLGLNLFILIWTTPLGLNVTSDIPPFIYSVGPGNHFMLLDPDVFFALFFVAGNFRSDFSCHPFLFRVSTHMTHWQYPPHQWPQVKLLTMVRKVAFGVGFSVLLILENFHRNSLLTFL